MPGKSFCDICKNIYAYVRNTYRDTYIEREREREREREKEREREMNKLILYCTYYICDESIYLSIYLYMHITSIIYAMCLSIYANASCNSVSP
jgi:hypothetical protein